MKKIPTIGELMTPFPHAIYASKTVKQAKIYMYEHSIRHLPVIDEGELIGLITDRDLKLAQAVTEDDHFDERHSVGELCVYEAYVVPAETRADKVLALMAENRIGSTIITKGDKLVGVFTATDACRSFSNYLRAKFGINETTAQEGADTQRNPAGT